MRRRILGKERLGWEQCKHVHTGENFWQRGRNSSKRGNSGHSIQKWDGIYFTDRRVSFSEKKEKSPIHWLRRASGIHGWVTAHTKFASREDRKVRDCQWSVSAFNYSERVKPCKGIHSQDTWESWVSGTGSKRTYNHLFLKTVEFGEHWHLLFHRAPFEVTTNHNFYNLCSAVHFTQLLVEWTLNTCKRNHEVSQASWQVETGSSVTALKPTEVISFCKTRDEVHEL